MALSVHHLAAIAQSCGAAFIREPFSGRVALENADRVPASVIGALQARWGDVEAMLNEMSPPNAVEAAERILSEHLVVMAGNDL